MKPLVHIGYQKTASTWLQREFFNNHNPIFREPLEFTYGEAHQHFIYGREFDFDAEAAIAAFSPGIEHCEKNGFIPVISNENLVGNPILPYDYAKPTAEKICRVFPEARVLIFVRDQKSIIASLYRQSVREGRKDSLRDFLKGRFNEPGFWSPFIPERLKYDELISYYFNLFGQERVLVISFDEFKRSNLSVTEKILKFVDRQELLDSLTISQEFLNYGHRGLSLEIRRKLNYVMPKPDFSGGKLSLPYRATDRAVRSLSALIPDGINTSFESRLRQEIKSFIGDFYVESNLRLKELTGISFGKF
jgi:hypothetical protein